MRQYFLKSPFFSIFRRLRWYLTLSYNLASLAAIFLLGWWGLLVAIFYLQRTHPTSTWFEIAVEQLLPALRLILPWAVILILPAMLVSAYFGWLNARWLDVRLANLRKAAQAWKRGDFSKKVQDDVEDEIGGFGQELNGMAAELERLFQVNQDLAVSEERNRMARDLHDSVKQQITAASFQIGAAKALLDSDPQAARLSLEAAENLTHEAHQELNSLIFELRPVALKSGSLESSLREYVAHWNHQNQIEARLLVQGTWNPGALVQQEVFRFVQEALSNVARHSQASLVTLSLTAGPKEIGLTIQDNGCGFELEAVKEKGYGLKTMAERIQRLGGVFYVESRPLEGTKIMARIPA